MPLPIRLDKAAAPPSAQQTRLPPVTSAEVNSLASPKTTTPLEDVVKKVAQRDRPDPLPFGPVDKKLPVKLG